MMRKKLSFFNRIRFLLGLPMHNVFGSGITDKELHNLISGSVDEINEKFKKITDPEMRNMVLYTAALQLRIAKYNIIEAGYPDIMINSIFKDQP